MHGHLTPAIIKVSDEGLVRLEGAHVITFVSCASTLNLPVAQLAVNDEANVIRSPGFLL